ncbi:DUF6980 family protein [Alcanivorax sediminis]|uniref:DUF6980 domain-containing protein n=1 Tax=Alcanivorax sediminis TaxID=2663008 RepID=A0A6N7LW13_9GAMM|nr:hypothetical protein [Alcanivorax sediminis]
MTKHCCADMDRSMRMDCDVHESAYDCPDVLVSYVPRFDEYGLIIHDGGTSSIEIVFCPWCGRKLPESKRDQWFDELERLGFDDPALQEIPDAFKSDAWYRDT